MHTEKQTVKTRASDLRYELLLSLSEFSVVDSHAQEFSHAWGQFWPDALPAATNDSYGYQRELNTSSLGASDGQISLVIGI